MTNTGKASVAIRVNACLPISPSTSHVGSRLPADRTSRRTAAVRRSRSGRSSSVPSAETAAERRSLDGFAKRHVIDRNDAGRRRSHRAARGGRLRKPSVPLIRLADFRALRRAGPEAYPRPGPSKEPLPGARRRGCGTRRDKRDHIEEALRCCTEEWRGRWRSRRSTASRTSCGSRARRTGPVGTTGRAPPSSPVDPLDAGAAGLLAAARPVHLRLP